MVIYDLVLDPTTEKEELKFTYHLVVKEDGVQYVMMLGIVMMPGWCVDNWDLVTLAVAYRDFNLQLPHWLKYGWTM